MDLFDKISISQIIWYLVPGLGLLFFLFFPMIVFSLETTTIFFNAIGPFGLVLSGIVFGFMLEGLRLYRFRRNYHTIKKDFFITLQKTLNAEDLNPYFILSHITDIAKKKQYTGLSLSHSIWIMLGHFTIIAFLESVFWLIATIFFVLIATTDMSVYFNFCATVSYDIFGISANRGTVIGICILFSILSFGLSWRFNSISKEEQTTTNKKYLEFAKQHCDEIRSFLNLPITKDSKS